MAEGTRSGLWAAMRHAIATLKPSYVIWENVNGCRSATAASALESGPGCVGAGVLAGQPVLRALGRVLGDLAALGFDAEWRSVRASDVGCCHRRERVFVLAWPAADADGVSGELRRSPAAGETPRGWASGAPARRAPAFVSDTDRQGRREPPHRRGAGECASWQDVLTVGHGWGKFEDAIRSHQQLLGRTAPLATEPGPLRGTPWLSARFVEWMMALPDGWVVDVPGLTRRQQLAMLGNGVVPFQAAHALEDMLTHVPSKAIA
jgi:gp69